MLQVAGASLLVYAFLGGIIVPDEPFFPANILNYSLIESILGIPVEVYRSVIGLILAYSMIRAMEIFEIEVDQMIEKLEISTIRRNERDLIGQEIHDGVLQSIYSASLITSSLTSFANNNPDLIDRIEQVREVLNQAIVEMREYMVSLRIPKTKSGLKAELLELINQPRFIGLVNVTLDSNVKDILSPSQCGHIIGIVQEGLSNIVRHAKAKNVKIIFILEEEVYTLSIIDDGIGFDPKTSNQGFGLEAIRDHTQLLGADLSINSTRKIGTTLSIQFREK
jgi:signal transduction histidine kinase